MGKQRKIIAGSEGRRQEAQRNEPGKIHPDGIAKPYAQGSQHKAQTQQCFPVPLFKKRPQEHTNTQTMQHAEVNNNAPVCKAQCRHGPCDQEAYDSPGQHRQPPAHRAAAQSSTKTGQNQKQTSGPLLKVHEPSRQIPADKAVQLRQIVDQVDEDHAQQAQPPESIQFPDALFQFWCSCSAASSSSTR